MKKIVLAGGCFWGVEEFFSRISGVISTEVGYANGNTENPTYEEVCTKKTGFAEAVAVTYDKDELTLKYILEKYWSVVDPTSLNKQGGDIGTQYRTGIYYLDEDELPIILKSKEEQQKKYSKPIVTEIEPLRNFYSGEEYHQKYLKKNPGGYCHIRFDED